MYAIENHTMYEKVLSSLYFFGKSNDTELSSGYWDYYRQCWHYARKTDATSYDLEKYHEESVRIKVQIRRAIDYRLGYSSLEDNTRKIDVLLDYRLKLVNCFTYTELSSLISDMYTYFLILEV